MRIPAFPRRDDPGSSAARKPAAPASTEPSAVGSHGSILPALLGAVWASASPVLWLQPFKARRCRGGCDRAFDNLPCSLCASEPLSTRKPSDHSIPLHRVDRLRFWETRSSRQSPGRPAVGGQNRRQESGSNRRAVMSTWPRRVGSFRHPTQPGAIGFQENLAAPPIRSNAMAHPCSDTPAEPQPGGSQDRWARPVG